MTKFQRAPRLLSKNYFMFAITSLTTGCKSTLREENKFGRKECGIKDCELDL